MTTYNVTSGVVKSASNTIGEIVSFSYESTIALASDTQLTDEWETHLPGKKSWTGNLTMQWDPDDAGQTDIVVGDLLTIHWHPEGVDSGDVDATGTGYVESISITVGEEGAVRAECTIKGSGALAIGAVA